MSKQITQGLVRRSAMATILILTIVGLSVPCAAAEEPCIGTTVVTVPSRPTVANGTDITQCGVAELEYGLERQWPGAGAHRSDISGGIRFGLTHNLDFHWFSGDFISASDSEGNRTGHGDDWFGLKYRLTEQTKRLPSFGVFYNVKAPTGNLALGSSGEVDHAFSFLTSKDVKYFHFDFNVIPQLAGRPDTSGFDHNVGFALTTALRVSRRWTLITEPYGFTALNDSTREFTAMMGGVTFLAHPRLLLDGGLDVATSQYAPRKRVFAGITYAIANVYTWLHPEKN